MLFCEANVRAFAGTDILHNGSEPLRSAVLIAIADILNNAANLTLQPNTAGTNRIKKPNRIASDNLGSVRRCRC